MRKTQDSVCFRSEDCLYIGPISTSLRFEALYSSVATTNNGNRMRHRYPPLSTTAKSTGLCTQDPMRRPSARRTVTRAARVSTHFRHALRRHQLPYPETQSKPWLGKPSPCRNHLSHHHVTQQDKGYPTTLTMLVTITSREATRSY